MRIIKLFGNLFLIPLYLFSFICPRSKNIWVFGSWFGTRFADSSRYVYEYIIYNEPSIRPIWLTRDKHIISELKQKGYEVYHIHSIAGFWYTCRASAALFTVNITDINTVGASRILKFQLWHGIPLKKIVYDDNYNQPNFKGKWMEALSKIKSFILPFKDVYGKWDAVSSTSIVVSGLFKTAFQLPQDRILITGTPRADIILSKQPVKPDFLATEGNMHINNRIAYFPTHRVEAETLSDFINSLNDSKLPELLEFNNSVLYIKLHYYNLEHHVHLVQSPRIILLQENDESDINFLLPWVDVLITDYSSVYFDYLLLNRPIIFTPFDLDSYLSKDRELYGDYNLLTPGPICITWNEVADELSSLFMGDDMYKVARNDMRLEYHTFFDTNNSMRVVNATKSLLKQKKPR